MALRCDSFGKRLRAARAATGITQRDLAADAGWSHAYVAHLETGRIDYPCLDAVETLARVLGVKPEWLAFGVGGVPKLKKRAARRERVYFIRRAYDGAFKIGRSVCPEQRFDQLRTASADILTLVATIPGGARKELALHKRFAPYRITREWFASHHELNDFVNKLRRAA